MAEQRLGSLGWLAMGQAAPKKRKDIEGVGGSSILELQAQLYRTQEHVKKIKSGEIDPTEKHVRRKGGFDVASLMAKKNEGVDSRDQRDREQLKTANNRESECYAALERKAALYDKLARGEVDDEEERYEVDFLRKGEWRGAEGPASGRGRGSDSGGEDGWGRGRSDDRDRGHDAGPSGRSGQEAERRERDKARGMGNEWAPPPGLAAAPIDSMGEAVAGTGGMASADMERERERRRWEQEQQQRALHEQEGDERKRRHKEIILGLASETREQRERAAQLKQAKEEQAKGKLDRLKAEFLKKQLAAAKQQAGAGKGAGAVGKQTGGAGGAGHPTGGSG